MKVYARERVDEDFGLSDYRHTELEDRRRARKRERACAGYITSSPTFPFD